MRQKNILSFLRDDTPKPAIDKTRHINHQMALSFETPKEFQLKHAKIEKILFENPPDEKNKQELEHKRIKWYGKALNLQHEYQLQLKPNLSQTQDKKINETIQEAESRVIRQTPNRFRFTDRIGNRTIDMESQGRIIDQKCAFTENYDEYSKKSFKLSSGIFEQFKNAQLLQKRYHQQEYLIKRNYFDYSKTMKRKQNNLQLSQIDPIQKEEKLLLFSSPVDYLNNLSRKIAKETIEKSVRSKRTISCAL